MMKKLLSFFLWLLLAVPAVTAAASAAEPPDKLIERLSNEILDRIKADAALQAGDRKKLDDLVDNTVMPHVDFRRMTALSVGRNWRAATPEQQKQLMDEFRALLIRTYAGALSSVADQKVRMRPLRANPQDTDLIVRSEVVQPRGEPIQLDYRMSKAADGWKIYDVNVLGVWLVETYRTQFAQEVSAGGIEGLIRSLSEKNKKPAANGKT